MNLTVRAELARYADRKKAALLQGYFKTGPGEYAEGDVFLGVCVPDIRRVAKKCGALASGDIRGLLRSRIHEERLLALIVLVERFKNGDEKARETIFRLYLAHTRYINNWDLVDLSAWQIVGGFLKDKSKNILYKLARSPSLWERRIAVLATFYYIREGDCAESFRVARLLLSDSHDLIHKAVGWMLREAGKRCSLRKEEDFLRRHYRTMPRTMLRYAIERFPEKKRQRYLRKPRPA